MHAEGALNTVSAFLLGTVQGLTEFLPVSSSGHLVIAQHLLGWREPAVFFDICLHIGTLLAVLIILRKDVIDLIRGGLGVVLRKPFGNGVPLELPERTFFLVLVGTLPTVLMGLFARHYLEEVFASLMVVSFNLLLTGTFLWLTRYMAPLSPKSILSTRWQHTLWIGLAQGFALAPGISRSGITIAAGLFLGLDRDWAGRFSFLLFVPAAIGAVILESTHLDLSTVQVMPTLMGIITATVTGCIALRLLLGLVRKGRFYVFAPYCWGLGIFFLLWSVVSPN